jgi:hypothetical protein
MDAETVVEAVQQNAAAEVAQVAAAGDAVIEAQVGAVADALADHAEVSEERHDEILEGEEWLRTEVTNLKTAVAGLSGSMGQLGIQLSTIQSNLGAIMENQQNPQQNPPNPSQDSSPSTPPAEPPKVEAVVIVEPEKKEEGVPSDQKTKPPAATGGRQPVKRRLI